MIPLDDDERKRMLELISNVMGKDIDKVVSRWNSYSTSTHPVQHNPYHNFPHGGMSPTDKDARGRYPYQEPEVDEQGTYYGYKILVRIPQGSCPCPDCQVLASPRYKNCQWRDGELTSNREPDARTMFGIHCTKRPDHPELNSYKGTFYDWFLVKCALSGTIVETEQGFRAQHARIIAVMEMQGDNNGYWRSYQDCQKRPRHNPYSNPFKEEAEDRRWRYYGGGYTNTNPHINTDP
jgi:hypothetical protein